MICNKKFANKSALRQHKNIHDKVHRCETCQKCFGSKVDLDRHIIIHTGEKPYVCSKCDKRFRRKDHLKDHEAIHSDVRKFKCNICLDERSFKTKRDLSKHMLFHYKPKHSCPNCGKKFYTPGDMKRHLKRNKC